MIIEQVRTYLDAKPNENSELVLENIEKLNDPFNNDKLKNKIVVSLLNLEKKRPSKNTLDNQFIKENKPKSIHLYVLFTANYDTYERSLISISNIMEFFQSKKGFTQINTSHPVSNPLFENTREFKCIIDLYTPTFEQLNHLWETLGDKSVSSILYKVSISAIEKSPVGDMRKLVNEISGIIRGKNEMKPYL